MLKHLRYQAWYKLNMLKTEHFDHYNSKSTYWVLSVYQGVRDELGRSTGRGAGPGLAAHTDFGRHADCPNEIEGREFIRTPGSKGDV